VVICDAERVENSGTGNLAGRLRAAQAAGVSVVKLNWLLESVALCDLLPLTPYAHDLH